MEQYVELQNQYLTKTFRTERYRPIANDIYKKKPGSSCNYKVQ